MYEQRKLFLCEGRLSKSNQLFLVCCFVVKETPTGRLIVNIFNRFLNIQGTRHNGTQHNDTQHNDTQHDETQHIDTQQNDTQYDDNQHNGI
jgi:hypothetical protein